MHPPRHTTSVGEAGHLPQPARLAGCHAIGAPACPLENSLATVEETEAWCRRLDEEKNSLVAMVRGTETEFLATGEGLTRIAEQLTGIQRECQLLTELTLGQTPDAAVQFAFQLLKKAEDLVLASDEQYAHVFATFGELQARLAQFAKQQEELMQVLVPLKYISTCIRIEVSRHPADVQQAFFTLTGGVKKTVSEVRTTMEGLFADLTAREHVARTLMEQVSASIQRHQREVTATLKTSRTQLRALSDALNGSGAGAADLTHRNQTVTRHIGAIVMAQQCQDITRQRIEHVGEAMDQMRAQLSETRVTAGTADSDPRTFVFRAAQIQLHQIQSVFAELNRAADNLKSGIHALRVDAGVAAEAAVKVGGSARDSEIANQCQAGIGQILAIVKQAVDKTGDVLAAFVPLQAGFRDCTSKAIEHAGDVRLAGLNAQIFAIHSRDGAPLAVLAGRMRVISGEAIQQVVRMGAALNHTTEMVNNLRQRLEDFQILGQTELEILADESARSRKKLSELENAIPTLIGRVTERQNAFAASVEAVLTNVQFPSTVAAASSRSMGFFQDLVTWSGAAGRGWDGESAGGGKVDRLKSSYTMDSERLAHAAALQLFTTPLAKAALSPPSEVFVEAAVRLPALALAIPVTVLEKPATGTDLGDNVDLF